MITHVTYNADRWWSDSPNNEDIQLMTLMSADNSWTYEDQSTDLWPLGSNDAFTDTSSPAAKLNMKANGSITGNAGYLGTPVTDMVINPDGTASFWYIKSAAPDPTIIVSQQEVNFGNVMMNNSDTITFKVSGQALTGNVTVSLNDEAGVFSITPTVISANEATNGMNVTVTFSPNEIRDYNATVTLSSQDAQDVVVNLNGRGMLEGYTPVMQPAIDHYINLTEFRADWTDQTPFTNVASYTLEVSTKPQFKLLESADFSGVPNVLTQDGNSLEDIAGNYSDYLPDGWSATSYLGAYDHALITGYGGTIMTPNYHFAGYGKVTVVITAAAYYYNNASINVSTSLGSQDLSVNNDMTTYTLVLDCADNDAVILKSLTNYASIKQVDIYAGEEQTSLRAVETGDATYRLITGITNRFYTVKNLEAAGTYVYKVKTLYTDGTESPWSNIEEVTLIENVHSFSMGDVNHDGSVSVVDATVLIDYLLGSGSGICEICSDVNGDNEITVADVTDLIDMLLND